MPLVLHAGRGDAARERRLGSQGPGSLTMERGETLVQAGQPGSAARGFHSLIYSLVCSANVCSNGCSVPGTVPGSGNTAVDLDTPLSGAELWVSRSRLQIDPVCFLISHF